MKYLDGRPYLLVLLFFALVFLSQSCEKKPKHLHKSTDSSVSIEYPETYELSNIILALTDYGKSDRWEVRKGFPYYKKVMAHFESFKRHPLLDSVNYSRERWKEYLSFRTDAYAFAFNERGDLERKKDFLTNPEVSPFDDYLELINDFAKQTNFREFFKRQKPFRDSVLKSYKKDYFINEMRSFLQNEFTVPVYEKKYKVVLSPFVYRMNCHRSIDSVTEADFPTLSDYILFDSIPGSLENKIIACHSLFTEMDHAYVNPTSSKYADDIEKVFKDSIWDIKSGYQAYERGVFNEYMTWAVYDLFVYEFFPEQAGPLTTYWHYQNESRGFRYSYYFANLLRSIYENRMENELIENLFPKLLNKISESQQHLTKPEIKSNDTIKLKKTLNTKIQLCFSEPMQETHDFQLLLRSQKKTDTIDITRKSNLIWSSQSKIASFNLDLSKYKGEYLTVYFNWWGVEKPLVSKKGVLLTSGSKVVLKND